MVAELLPESKAQVFNAGAPVWGIDWCPIYIEDRPRMIYSIIYRSLSSVNMTPCFQIALTSNISLLLPCLLLLTLLE